MLFCRGSAVGGRRVFGPVCRKADKKAFHDVYTRRGCTGRGALSTVAARRHDHLQAAISENAK